MLDTSVVVAAFRSNKGASSRLFRLVANRRIVPLASRALFLEYEAVSKRDEHRRSNGFSLAETDGVLNALAAAIEPVNIAFSWRPQLNDPDDEIVLDTAVNRRADALITFNIRDFALAAPRFGLRVLSPKAALQEILQ